MINQSNISSSMELSGHVGWNIDKIFDELYDLLIEKIRIEGGGTIEWNDVVNIVFEMQDTLDCNKNKSVINEMRKEIIIEFVREFLLERKENASNISEIRVQNDEMPKNQNIIDVDDKEIETTMNEMINNRPNVIKALVMLLFIMILSSIYSSNEIPMKRTQKAEKMNVVRCDE